MKVGVIFLFDAKRKLSSKKVLAATLKLIKVNEILFPIYGGIIKLA